MNEPSIGETLAVLVSQVADARQDIQQMRNEVAAARGESVSRNEWLQRNKMVDERFGAQGREIGDLRGVHVADMTMVRNDINSKRAPWWSVVSLIIAAAAVAATFLPAITSR